MFPSFCGTYEIPPGKKCLTWWDMRDTDHERCQVTVITNRGFALSFAVYCMVWYKINQQVLCYFVCTWFFFLVRSTHLAKMKHAESEKSSQLRSLLRLWPPLRTALAQVPHSQVPREVEVREWPEARPSQAANTCRPEPVARNLRGHLWFRCLAWTFQRR